MPYDGQVAKEIITENKGRYPSHSSDHIIQEKPPIPHGSDTGNKGGKGSNNSDKNER